jgi:glycosyltransferase involved in cell wall biosynthesis
MSSKKMSSKPLVSVIIIFFQAEKFFEEAIESVLAQTYNNWELLLVDDGSTDSSTVIAQKYVERYPQKVRYLEHEGHQNRGMSATRNLGIRNAKGEYIAFLDADDVWLPQKLERQVAIMESQLEAGMIYGRTQYWYSWTGNPEDVERDFMPELSVHLDTLVRPPALSTLFLKGAEPPSTCSVLIRHQLIKHVGGFEESFRGMYEDQVFFYKVCLKASVFVESGCWDRYRQHQNSCCHVALNQGQFHPQKPNPVYLTFLNWLEKYLSEQGVNDTEVWQALRIVQWPYRHPTLYRLSQYTQHLKGGIKGLLKFLVRQTLPVPIRRWLQTQLQGATR